MWDFLLNLFLRLKIGLWQPVISNSCRFLVSNETVVVKTKSPLSQIESVNRDSDNSDHEGLEKFHLRQSLSVEFVRQWNWE